MRNEIVQSISQCDYFEAIKSGSVCAEAAREAIRYRFRDPAAGKTKPINTSINVAAVTLIFSDGRSITRVNESSNSEEFPLEYRHAEARAIATVVTAAIDDGQLDGTLPRFTHGSSVPAGLFDAWKSALKNDVSKIIIYSDRSPCPPCDLFIKKILADVNYEFFFSVTYRPGAPGNLGKQIVDTKKSLDEESEFERVLSMLPANAPLDQSKVVDNAGNETTHQHDVSEDVPSHIGAFSQAVPPVSSPAVQSDAAESSVHNPSLQSPTTSAVAQEQQRKPITFSFNSKRKRDQDKQQSNSSEEEDVLKRKKPPNKR